MNLVSELLNKTTDEDTLIDQILFVMNFWHMSKRQCDNLTIPEYMFLRDYAIKVTREQNRQMSKIRRR